MTIRTRIAQSLNALAERIAPTDTPGRPVDLNARARWAAEDRADLPPAGVLALQDQVNRAHWEAEGPDATQRWAAQHGVRLFTLPPDSAQRLAEARLAARPSLREGLDDPAAALAYLADRARDSAYHDPALTLRAVTTLRGAL